MLAIKVREFSSSGQHKRGTAFFNAACIDLK